MKTKMTALFVLALLVGFAFADTSGVNLTVGNVDPVIVSVDAKAAEDPTSCTTTAVGALTFNVTDANGAEDLKLASTYVNFSNGAVVHQAATCVNSSSGTDWMVISCTGADFDYYDVADDWTVTAYVEDNGAGWDTDATTTMAYNEGVYMRLVNDPITFGALNTGDTDKVNTNSPPLKSENCGNTILNLTVTGADITDGGTNTMDVGQFRIDDDATPSEGGGETNLGELTLTTAPQDFSKAGGQAVSTGTPATWSLYAFVNIPAIQAAATYDTGTWTFTQSKA